MTSSTLFGNPAVNSLIARVNDFLPVKFVGGAITAGRSIFTGEGTGAVVAFPNSLNRDRYVVVVGGLDLKSMETAGRLRLSEWPDYAIFDDSSLAGERTRFAAAGFFDKYWRLPELAKDRSK